MCVLHVTDSRGPAPTLPAVPWPRPGGVLGLQEESRAGLGTCPTANICWRWQQEEKHPSLLRTCGILVLWAPCGCAVYPKFTIAPEPCPGMTVALWAGCLLPAGCRDGREHVRVPEHPGQGIAFHEALSAPSLIISRCSAKFLPANP